MNQLGNFFMVQPSASYTVVNEDKRSPSKDNSYPPAKRSKRNAIDHSAFSLMSLPKDTWRLITYPDPRIVPPLNLVCKGLHEMMQTSPIMARLFEYVLIRSHSDNKSSLIQASYSLSDEVGKYIEYLNLVSCKRKDIVSLLNKSPNCEGVNLKNTDITDEDFKEISSSCRKLKFLNLSRESSSFSPNLPPFHQITDEGWGALGSLTQLKMLTLRGCCINDEALKNLSTLKNLEGLDLADCDRIQGRGLQSLKNLTRLKKLNLSNCKKIQEWKHLKVLTQLESLDLGQSSITNANLENLSTLTELKQLRLVDLKLPINETGLQYLGNLFQLKILALSRLAETAKLEQLKPLPQLTLLDLSATRIEEKSLEYLASLTHLKKLSLNSCSFTDKALENLKLLSQIDKLNLMYCSTILNKDYNYFTALTQLKTLRLKNNLRFGSTGLQHLASLPQLKVLGLGQLPKINDGALRHLSKLTQLETLYLNDSWITDIGLGHLTKTKNLRSLKLHKDTKMSLETRQWFKDHHVNVIFG